MEEIKKLREMTGAGIGDCKKALDEAQGDLEKAVEILRKKGIAKAAKRGDREANEGVIMVGVNEGGNIGYAIQINSETDFVARNEQFQEFGREVLKLAVGDDPKDMEELMSLSMGDMKVSEKLESLSGIIGEKLEIGAYQRLSGASVAAYSHMGGKIGVLTALDKEDASELAADVAMQVAATDPKYISPEDVDNSEIEKEKEIQKETLLKEGKPENIIDKILEGKINKYYEEICLVKQEYIKDDKQKVEQILDGAKVTGFVRFSLQGESTVC
ncbi:elongation factor Ts [Candidatus Falkowbacteria bacterium]|nr:elongation factor Ts [Candidatus Falkowbacteria bacterium]